MTGEQKDSKRDAIEKCIALKKMPHVYNRIKSVWGYPEFFETVDALLFMEPGREGRAGFPEGVYKEIDALKRLFMAYPDEVMAPFLNEAQRKKIKDHIHETSVRLNFSTGDRR